MTSPEGVRTQETDWSGAATGKRRVLIVALVGRGTLGPHLAEPPMSDDELGPTVPRTPLVAEADDTKSRAAEDSSADQNRTANFVPAEAGTGTVARTPSDTARQEADAQSRAAAGVPGYVLLRELGRGGMGVVYQARHVKLNRVVALKMMLGGEQASRGELIRFLAEAEAVAAVRHENVVQVYDFGEADGRPFMALEFCPGGTLGRLLSNSPDAARTPTETAALIAQVARGVAAAHTLGIVHRDLKPNNVFLDEAGVPKVADFGLAKRGDGADVTQEGQGMGSPAYMAPEQARNAKFVGPQADVWALGVMLYEALTSARPFTGTVQEIMARAQNAEPIPPRKIISKVPRDLELICLKCLSKVPHERYPMAKELADDLDRFARNEPISVRPAGPIERAVKWVRRNKIVSGAIATVFVALATGAGVSLGFGLEARDQAAVARKRTKEAEEATEREAKQKQAVIDARNETKRKSDEQKLTLAKALLGPITAKNRKGPLPASEVEALWQITKLRRDEVAWMLLEEATRTPLTRKQLENRAEYIFHAAIGLDITRRDDTERLLLTGLQHKANNPHAVSLALAVAQLGSDSSALISVATETLLARQRQKIDDVARLHLAESLGALVERMEPTEATKVFLAALEKELRDEPNYQTHSELVQSIRVLAERTKPTACATLLLLALEKEKDYKYHHDLRQQLAEDLAAVAVNLEPTETAKVCTRAAEILLAALEGETRTPAPKYLAKGVAAVAAHLEPATADKVREKATELLLAALEKATSSWARATTAEGLSAVAAHMKPTERGPACDRAANILLTAMKKEEHPFERNSLARGLSAVAVYLEPSAAARMLLTALNEETEFLARLYLVEGLSVVARRLEPTVAANVRDLAAQKLLLAIEADVTMKVEREAKKANTIIYECHYLAEGLSVIARHEPTAAKACSKAAVVLLAALEKVSHPSNHRDLAEMREISAQEYREWYDAIPRTWTADGP